MSTRSRGFARLPTLQRAGLAASALLCVLGLLALLAGGAHAQGAFVAVATLLPSALLLVGAPRKGRPAWGALLAALALGALLLVSGVLLATGVRSMVLLLAGLGLAPLALTLLVYTLRFRAEQEPSDAELASLRRMGDEP